MLQRALILVALATAAFTLAGVAWRDSGHAPVAPLRAPRPVSASANPSSASARDIPVAALAVRGGYRTVTRAAPVDFEDAHTILAGIAVSDPVPANREEALHWLGEGGGAVALLASRHALHDPSPRVRKAAIRALARIGGSEARLALGAVLQVPEAAMRLEAMDALALTDPIAARPALRAAQYDGDEVVRAAAAQWLDELPGAMRE